LCEVIVIVMLAVLSLLLFLCASDIVVFLMRQTLFKRQPLVTLSRGTGISDDEYLERQHSK
jgi:hypothetical protein